MSAATCFDGFPMTQKGQGGRALGAALVSSAVGGIYGTQAIPTTYIVDRLGNIVARAVGGLGWDTPAMFAIFDKLLEL